jgi:hypothetical protein
MSIFTHLLLGLSKRLDGWRNELARRYSAIAAFHDAVKAACVRSVNDAGYPRWQRDETAYRAFLESKLRELSNRLSGVVALAIAETGKLVARFSDWCLCEGNKPKSVPTSEKIERKLREAFPGSGFRVEVQP